MGTCTFSGNLCLQAPDDRFVWYFWQRFRAREQCKLLNVVVAVVAVLLYVCMPPDGLPAQLRRFVPELRRDGVKRLLRKIAVAVRTIGR